MVMDWPYGDQTLLWPGSPIRIPRDLRFCAAPSSVSPLYASFIGTPPQGIHQTPFVAYELPMLAESPRPWKNNQQTRFQMNMRFPQFFTHSLLVKVHAEAVNLSQDRRFQRNGLLYRNPQLFVKRIFKNFLVNLRRLSARCFVSRQRTIVYHIDFRSVKTSLQNFLRFS